MHFQSPRLVCIYSFVQWRRLDFITGGKVRYGSIGGLEYEVTQSRLYCLCINVALCSTALQCICRVIRRSSTTMKAHTYYIFFGRPPIGGSFPPFPPGGATAFVHSTSLVPSSLVHHWAAPARRYKQTRFTAAAGRRVTDHHRGPSRGRRLHAAAAAASQKQLRRRQKYHPQN